ncbi:hypothetical protein V6N12_071471 [Hibiscus sabdariffa]|uniref:Uncharacterized protein n=1 Tax=Hibiscus sabdariffa TaxID=183260 RepID=A0ABR2FJV7_9ROSI
MLQGGYCSISGKKTTLRFTAKSNFHVSHISEKGGSVTVASKDVVVREPVTLKTGNYVAVRVTERGADLGPKKGGGRRVMAGLKDGITKDKLRIGSAKGRCATRESSSQTSIKPSS